jgi:hypothetical protein
MNRAPSIWANDHVASKIQDQAEAFCLSPVPDGGKRFPLKIIGKYRYFHGPGCKQDPMPVEPVHHFATDDSLLHPANAEDL